MIKKISFIIFLGLIIAGGVFIIFGFNINTTDRIFTTKYYETPKLAFETDYKEEDTIKIESDFYIYKFDDYNCIYFAKTTDDKILCATMIMRRDTYFYTGKYLLYTLDNNKILDEGDFFKTNIYDEIGINVGSRSWKLTNQYSDESHNYLEIFTLENIKVYLVLSGE